MLFVMLEGGMPYLWSAHKNWLIAHVANALYREQAAGAMIVVAGLAAF
jgi:hypothetical protein